MQQWAFYVAIHANVTSDFEQHQRTSDECESLFKHPISMAARMAANVLHQSMFVWSWNVKSFTINGDAFALLFDINANRNEKNVSQHV